MINMNIYHIILNKMTVNHNLNNMTYIHVNQYLNNMTYIHVNHNLNNMTYIHVNHYLNTMTYIHVNHMLLKEYKHFCSCPKEGLNISNVSFVCLMILSERFVDSDAV
jgi:hypothetical protein